MPSAAELARAYRHPRRARAYQWGEFDPAGNRGLRGRPGFAPGTVFDLYDPAGNRLGWGSVGLDGAIELFDAAGNRLGMIRPSMYRQFEGVVREIIHAHPEWTHVEIIKEYRRQTEGG